MKQVPLKGGCGEWSMSRVSQPSSTRFARLIFLHQVHLVHLIFSSWAVIGDNFMIDGLTTKENQHI